LIHITVGISAILIAYLLFSEHITDRLVGFGYLGLAFGIVLKHTNFLERYTAYNNIYYYLGSIMIVAMMLSAHVLGNDIYGAYYIPYVTIALTGVFLISIVWSYKKNNISKLMVLLGKHSLLVYLYQVASARFLYIIFQTTNLFDPDQYIIVYMLAISLMCVTMVGLVFLIEYYTDKSATFRNIYNSMLR
jgi:hypothetical protein